MSLNDIIAQINALQEDCKDIIQAYKDFPQSHYLREAVEIEKNALYARFFNQDCPHAYLAMKACEAIKQSGFKADPKVVGEWDKKIHGSPKHFVFPRFRAACDTTAKQKICCQIQ